MPLAGTVLTRHGLHLFTAAKMCPDILAAVQHAHDQDTIGLLLVIHHVAAMHDAAESGRLQILTCDACKRIIG
jgi:hypothetical protein